MKMGQDDFGKDDFLSKNLFPKVFRTDQKFLNFDTQTNYVGQRKMENVQDNHKERLHT